MEERRLGIYTDLAMEAREAGGELPGVDVEEQRLGGITVTRVGVTDAAGAEAVGKPIGTYVTVECADLPLKEPEGLSALRGALAGEIAKMLPKKRSLSALVVGLGNWNMTPDALGPRTVAKVLVTRHIKARLPEGLGKRMRSVCALSPGVLGITGMETGEVVRGVAERVKPDVVLCVDSLAARRTGRILTTVQLADTGVRPGSGVGNARGEISEATVGVPVIAIGVPMVVRASTIARDAVEGLLGTLKHAAGEGGEIYDLLTAFGQEGLDEAMRQAIPPEIGALIVTPSGIDEAVDAAASAVAMGINIALHPKLDVEEIVGLLS